MMLWLYDALLALYPARVRAEFGHEMRGVFLEARAAARERGAWAYAGFCLRETLGLIGGLLGSGGVFRYSRWITVCALAGAAVAGVATWREASAGYVSKGLLQVVPPQVPSSVVPTEPLGAYEINAMSQRLLSRSSLTNIISSFGLYLEERHRLPMEDVVEMMRRDIVIRFKEVQSGSAVEIGFTYALPQGAQRVTQSLLSGCIDETVRQRSSRVTQTVTFLEDMAADAARKMDAAYARLRQTTSRGDAFQRLELDALQTRRHYESLREKLAEAQMRQRLEERRQGTLLQVLDPASLPFRRLAEEYFPQSVGLGALVGLVAGGAIGMSTAWLFAWWPWGRRAWAPAGPVATD